MDKLTMTRQEIAKALGIGMHCVDALLRRAVDPVPSLRVGKRVLIPCQEFKEWLSRQASNEEAC